MNNTERNIEIINLYKSGVPATKIAINFMLTRERVGQILKENGITLKKDQKFTIDNPQILIDAYLSGKSPRALGAEYGVADGTIASLLRRHNVKIRDSSHAKQKYAIDEHVYDTIDNQDKAYFLGLLMADGNSSSSGYCIRIDLQERDRELVEKFRRLFKTNRPLTFSPKKTTEGHMCQAQIGCAITNKHVAKSLAKWGIVPNKTFIASFPEDLDAQYYPHFIRGLFDGDGSLSIDTIKNAQSFTIAGTEKLLLRIQEILCAACDLNKTKLIHHNTKGGGVYAIHYGGSLQVTRIKDYLYKDAITYLQRKKDKFDSIKILKKYPKPKKPTAAKWRFPEEELLSLYKSGLSAAQIAEHFGKQGYHTKVIRQLAEMNVKTLDRYEISKRKSDLHTEEIFKLHAEGLSSRAIGKQVGLNKNTVIRILRENMS